MPGTGVVIEGYSGTGKSTSMRNFKKGEVAIINPVGKPLPFRNDLPVLVTDDYNKIKSALKRMKTNAAVIDDAQYLMANEFMRRSSEGGFQKFTDIGKNFWSLIEETLKELPDDVIVYFLMHIEKDAEGREKAKTIGKMLDEKITLEGLFTIVLKTQVVDGKYTFRTQNSGNDTVKSPMGMFAEVEIDNDLKAVDTAIREYYNLKPLTVNNENGGNE